MVLRALVTLVFSTVSSLALAQQDQCDPSAFREVVASASASITKMHEANTKTFQDKLQKLRTLNKWSDAEYLAKATPFVKDSVTASFDSANQALLTKVESLEGSKATSATGRCAMLNELKLSMDQVVANTAAKWEHIMSNIEQATAPPLEAGLAH